MSSLQPINESISQLTRQKTLTNQVFCAETVHRIFLSAKSQNKYIQSREESEVSGT